MSAQPTSWANLEGIRGFSAFVVLLAHIEQLYWLRFWGVDSYVHKTFSFASHYAVVTFFLLSGFLITQSIEINVRKNGIFNVADYASARIARIYPPFLAALTLTFAVFGLLDLLGLPGRRGELALPADLFASRQTVALSLREAISGLLLLNGALDVNGALWSLYIEVKLYALLACAYCFRHWTSAVPSLCVGAVVVLAGLHFNPEFYRYAALWIIGCAAFYLHERGTPQRNRKVVLSFVAIAVCSGEGYVGQLFEIHAVPELSVRGALAELAIAALLAVVLFRWKVSVSVGRSMASYSYSLYVVHFPVLLLFSSLLVYYGSATLPAFIVFSLASAVAAMAVAWSFEPIEQRKKAIQTELRVLIERSSASVRAFLRPIRTG